MSKPTIGFIGLGAMGEPMAGRLLDAGFSVVSTVNHSREAIERLTAKGIREVDSARDVGEGVDILMSIVFDEPQTDAVLRGPSGALASLAEGAIVVVMSTVSPSYCQELATEAAGQGITVLDCPVSGLVKGARDGTLTLMVGGDAASVDRCREAFDALGNTMHCGDVGMGQLMKLANNAMSLSTFRALMEVRHLVAEGGMELDRFMEILNSSSGSSFVSKNFPLPKQPMAWPSMPIKDLSFCLSVAQQLGVEMPVIEASLDAGR